MSETLSTLSSGLSALNALLGATAVQLGPFAFADFEVPERLRWGGDHAGTLHKLIGGERVLDLTGPDDGPLEWSGILMGALAKDRARQLDAMRRQGGPFDLSWAGSSQRVWLRSCVFDEGYHRIEYRIVCEAIPEAEPDESDEFGPAGEVADGLRQPGATSGMGGVLADLTGNGSLGALAAQAGTVMGQVRTTGAALLGTAANVSALAGTLGLRTSMGSALATAERVLGAGGDVSARFGAVQAAAGQAASLVGAAGRLSRVTTLLGG